MSHNTTQVVMFVAFLIFVAFLMVKISPWFGLLLLSASGAFLTDLEIERKERKKRETPHD